MDVYRLRGSGKRLVIGGVAGAALALAGVTMASAATATSRHLAFPSYVTSHQRGILRASRFAVMLPNQVPSWWRRPHGVVLVTRSTRQLYNAPVGSWVVNFSNNDTARTESSLKGAIVLGQSIRSLPSCNRHRDPTVSCSHFRVRGLRVTSYSSGAHSAAAYWSYCRTGIMVWWEQGDRLSAQRIRSTIASFRGATCKS